ncbi:hypothetical protein IAR55_003729 [Kwoniella newhampshirensis]|uniref:Delta(24)-sterol reductase n=1 Tax=Kwoniella newhampshirensis TaxID=1651941 RepID=A0AAW0YP43_9TREE
MSLFTAFVLVRVTAFALYRYKPQPSRFCSQQDHADRLATVIDSLRHRPKDAKISLQRRTLQSNTIRNSGYKHGPAYFPVDLSSFNKIIRINKEESWVECEPGIPFSDLLRELLRYDLSPLVVVELPGITVGGAIAGGGLESSSFRHGQFNDTVLEMECLTPDQVVCSPSTNSDLFYAISASYNTVALLVKVKLKVQRAPKYVKLDIERYSSAKDVVEALGKEEGDCMEAIAFARDKYAVVRGRYTDTPVGKVSHFSHHYDRWYYKSVKDTSTMTVPYWDYCFRYNYGAFWMAEYALNMLGGDTFLTRLVFGAFLDTTHLFKVLHSSDLTDLGRMRVIQDFYVPRDRAESFIQEIDSIGVYPLWLCPIRSTQTPQHFACHYNQTDLINVGIYGRPRSFPFNARDVNDRLVNLLISTGGRSMLYAQNWHTPEQFDTIYGQAKNEIDRVKQRYDSDCFYDIYDKISLKAEERRKLDVPIVGSETDAQKEIVKNIILSKLGMNSGTKTKRG